VIDDRTPLVLDTSIVLLLCRGQAAAEHLDVRYALARRTPRPVISVVTVGEMLAFSRSLRWGQRKHDALRALLDRLLVTQIGISSILDAYADLATALQAAGRVMGQQNDLWIAATARALGATVLSTDKDFTPLDAFGVASEWVDPRSLIGPA